MKKCNKCKNYKLFEDFDKMKSGKYGLNGRCKVCRTKYMKKYSKVNKKKIARYCIEWYKENRIEALENGKKYSQTKVGKRNRYLAILRANKKYPQKHKARYTLSYAVKTGKLARLACEKCGNFLSQAHHPDYSKPLEVWWLCMKHHRQADKEELVLYG